MPQCLSVQVYFQRVLSTKTTRFAEMLSYIAGAGCTFITIPAMLIGICIILVNNEGKHGWNCQI
jgi:hypothetical protein